MDKAELEKAIKDLLASQQLAVLATQGGGQPYASLVAFAATGDLKHLVFATTRTTRKFANISEESRVALLVDNRANQDSDFHNAIAVTAMGIAREVNDRERGHFVKLYLTKHPHLQDFVMSPTCALLNVMVDRYYMVSRFQNVMEFHVDE